ncbi:MAG: selenide, water dikinase SelD, partial [Clostridia bacterium]|nr:selenide, water dikinase SelD [Clostridia bacterium]
ALFSVVIRRKAGMLSVQGEKTAVRLMTTLNRAARDAAQGYRVHACTDVTGFSLMGHGLEMAQGSGVSLRLSVSAIDLLPEAAELADMGLLPEGMYRNREYAQPHVNLGDTPQNLADVLFDPQTSGGLLLAVHPDDADELFEALKSAVPSAQRIGVVTTKEEKAITLVA